MYRRNAPAIAHAAAKGLGVAIMGPLGGGRLVDLQPANNGSLAGAALVDLALRFVMTTEGVCTVLSGMFSHDQLEANLASAADPRPLGPDDLNLLDRLAKDRETFQELVPRCGYCLPCPQAVDIRRVFLLCNLLKVAMHDPARLEYNHLMANKAGADLCAECGACLNKCPQKLEIPELLKQAHKTLTTW